MAPRHVAAGHSRRQLHDATTTRLFSCSAERKIGERPAVRPGFGPAVWRTFRGLRSPYASEEALCVLNMSPWRMQTNIQRAKSKGSHRHGGNENHRAIAEK